MIHRNGVNLTPDRRFDRFGSRACENPNCDAIWEVFDHHPERKSNTERSEWLKFARSARYSSLHTGSVRLRRPGSWGPRIPGLTAMVWTAARRDQAPFQELFLPGRGPAWSKD